MLASRCFTFLRYLLFKSLLIIVRLLGTIHTLGIEKQIHHLTPDHDNNSLQISGKGALDVNGRIFINRLAM